MRRASRGRGRFCSTSNPCPPVVVVKRFLFAFPLLVALAACGGAPSAPAGQLRVELDRKDPERLLRYYLGGYLAPGGADPFEAGVVLRDEGRLFVDPGALGEHGPALRGAAADAVLDWDEFAAFLQDTYYDARALPPTLDAFRAELPPPDSAGAWFRVDVDGVMTVATRRVYVEQAALRAALQGYVANGRRLLYPVGTAFVGEHWREGRLAEATVMRKRADGFWDYATYGPDGRLARQTQTPPRALKTPVQCVGCHFGEKLFEPEASFPGAAPDGPHGPRTLHVEAALRSPALVAFFDEHRKRSDGVLGLYNTLFVAQLQADRRAGRLPAADAALLDQLGL